MNLILKNSKIYVCDDIQDGGTFSEMSVRKDDELGEN